LKNLKVFFNFNVRLGSTKYILKNINYFWRLPEIVLAQNHLNHSVPKNEVKLMSLFLQVMKVEKIEKHMKLSFAFKFEKFQIK